MLSARTAGSERAKRAVVLVRGSQHGKMKGKVREKVVSKHGVVFH